MKSERDNKTYLVTPLITVTYEKEELENLRKYYRDLYTVR